MGEWFFLCVYFCKLLDSFYMEKLSGLVYILNLLIFFVFMVLVLIVEVVCFIVFFFGLMSDYYVIYLLLLNCYIDGEVVYRMVLNLIYY